MTGLIPAGQAFATFSKMEMQHSPKIFCNFLQKRLAKNKQCRPKIHKNVARFTTSKNASNRAKSQRYMQSEEFSSLARLRNGVETVMSNIRKNYHLDKLPRGKQRGKFFFGSKIAALNFRKLFVFRKGLGNYAQNPMLT